MMPRPFNSKEGVLTYYIASDLIFCLFCSCITLDKLLNFPKPEFHTWKMQVLNAIYLVSLLRERNDTLSIIAQLSAREHRNPYKCYLCYYFTDKIGEKFREVEDFFTDINSISIHCVYITCQALY